MRSEVYDMHGCVFVCLCMYRLGYSYSMKSFYKLLVRFSWANIMLRCRLIALGMHCSIFRTVHSKNCPWSVANLVILSIVRCSL